MQNYNIKRNYDSMGNDYDFIPNKTIKELIEICDNTDECVGFNSKGFLKKVIVDDSKLVRIQDIDLYINNDKINNIIERKKQIASGDIKKDITFVITTCKRLDYFINTMDKFLYHCQDLHIFSRFLCIDDNSSDEDRDIMKEKYPFFDFILKNKEQKGHAKSLNIMLDNVSTKYIFLFEDDWICSMDFYIEPYVRLLNEGVYHQTIFHTIISDLDDRFKFVRTINNTNMYEYAYNSECIYKSRLEGNYLRRKLEFEKEFNIKSQSSQGFHHPGFSLNPSIFNLSEIKKYDIHFSEDTKDNDIFELYFAFQCLKNNFKVALTRININHCGWGRSSYVLNDMKRSHDR